MNTYSKRGVDIENFRDLSSIYDHIESAWINVYKQILFQNKADKISNIYYSEFQREVTLVLKDSEQNNIVGLCCCQNRMMSLYETESNLLFSYLHCTARKCLYLVTCLTTFQ